MSTPALGLASIQGLPTKNKLLAHIPRRMDRYTAVHKEWPGAYARNVHCCVYGTVLYPQRYTFRSVNIYLKEHQNREHYLEYM